MTKAEHVEVDPDTADRMSSLGYRVERSRNKRRVDGVEVLNYLGRSGWELVSHDSYSIGGETETRYALKRPLIPGGSNDSVI